MKIDLSKIPASPGCYLYKDADGRIIYIGKAKNLKKRVSSYFQKTDHDPKTSALVSNIADMSWIVTDSEKEALLLENNMIKENKPKYNIDLKDSKRYAYILLTQEKYPRLIVARDKSLKGSYFGPFVSVEKRDVLLKFVIDTFKIRTCRKLPKRACLRYHMNLCEAPCILKISEQDYLNQIGKAKELLSGRSESLVKALKQEMQGASAAKDYEKAKRLRDQIYSIEALNEKQLVEKSKEYDQDAINYVVVDGNVKLAVFNINQGILLGKTEFEFGFKEGFLEEFISQYYSDEKIPKEIIIPKQITDSMQGFLSDIKGSAIRIIVPQKGENMQILNLVRKNLEKTFMEYDLALSDLKDSLGLGQNPGVIECFDISHLSGTDMVGSMVRFKDGKPDKSGYRRFRIKTVEGIDDFASIAEIVKRRYSRLQAEKSGFPDLIVIDGGSGQLSAAVASLDALRIRIPIISLAKRFEEVYIPGTERPIILERKLRALQLLQRIRDEAHRFAITYHKLLRKKRLIR